MFLSGWDTLTVLLSTCVTHYSQIIPPIHLHVGSIQGLKKFSTCSVTQLTAHVFVCYCNPNLKPYPNKRERKKKMMAENKTNNCPVFVFFLDMW